MQPDPRYFVVRTGPDLPANYLPPDLDGRWYGMPALAATSVSTAGMVLWPTADVEFRDDGAAAIVYEARGRTAEQSVRYENRVVMLPDRHGWLHGGLDPDDVAGLALDSRMAITCRYMRVDRRVELAVMYGIRVVAVTWLGHDEAADYDSDVVQRAFIDVERRAAVILARMRPAANSPSSRAQTRATPRSDGPVTTP